MKKVALAFTAAAFCFAATGAYAGGFGSGGATGVSSGLINISPTVGLGNITALNNIGNGNGILSGNKVSDVLNGNKTSIGGVLNGLGLGALNGGNVYKLGKH